MEDNVTPRSLELLNKSPRHETLSRVLLVHKSPKTIQTTPLLGNAHMTEWQNPINEDSTYVVWGLRKSMQRWAGNYRPDLKLMPGQVIGHVGEPSIVLEVWFSLFGCLCCYCCCCCWTDASKLLHVDVYTHRLELWSPLEMLLPVVGSRKYSAERYNEFDLQNILVIHNPVCLFFYIFAYTFDVLSKISVKTSIRKHSSNVSLWGLHILKI